MSTATVSRRDVVGLLRQMGDLDVAPATFDPDAVASRIRSLAVAASFESGARRGRWGRRAVAFVGAVGLIGWTGIGAASASVGLALTGNLPAPVQNFVSDVVDLVGIEIPKAEPPATPTGDDGSDEEDSGELPDDGDGGEPITDPSTTVPTDPTIVDPPGNSENAPGQTGQTPGQSGNTPGQSGNTPGQSGTRPPGQSGNTPGQSGQTPGQSGNTPGQSGNTPGQSGNTPGQSGNTPRPSDTTVAPPVTRPEVTPPDRPDTTPGRGTMPPGLLPKPKDDKPGRGPGR